MMRALLAMLLLHGCATQKEDDFVWARYDGGGSQQQLEADFGQCRAQAFSIPGAMNNLLQVAAVQSACLQGKGWYRQAR